ncbi:hypothetical protein [Lacrimispora saccharolytica]|uniref:hypothetical protein n=1 Tax=Lacrimispora saccharolytica TaxID=84030 RepID=UPI0019573779|nr:hypothetical protein [Lacrimispora saccharolytica]QRV20427.1 hypothetical protein I6K70_02430 [Lacrimispora saccharolytica]
MAQQKKENWKIRIRLIIPAGKAWDQIQKEDQINPLKGWKPRCHGFLPLEVSYL